MNLNKNNISGTGTNSGDVTSTLQAAGIQPGSWTILTFGRHKRKSLPQIVLMYPNWFFYIFDQGAFEHRGERLRIEADYIYDHARSIRVPQRGAEELVAEYGFHPFDRKHLCVEVVSASRSQHTGTTQTIRQRVFDLSIPYAQNKNANHLIKSVKYHLFDDSDFRFTKRRCEEFFEDDSHFDLSGYETGPSATHPD